MKNIIGDYRKLEEYINSNFGQNLIFDTPDGYILFRKYKITIDRHNYIVERRSDGCQLVFSNLRHATTWCILDHYNKIPESKLMLQLSKNLDSITTEILIHRNLQVKGSADFREINTHKLQSALARQKRFQFEADKYIKLAKICQDRGYNNELTRTTRK